MRNSGVVSEDWKDDNVIWVQIWGSNRFVFICILKYLHTFLLFSKYSYLTFRNVKYLYLNGLFWDCNIFRKQMVYVTSIYYKHKQFCSAYFQNFLTILLAPFGIMSNEIGSLALKCDSVYEHSASYCPSYHLIHLKIKFQISPNIPAKLCLLLFHKYSCGNLIRK